MASPLPTLQYLVAFQNNAYDDPALITSVASPGVLGANNVWTDITSFVQSHTFDRGRQHELAQFEAGTCSLVLNNRDGRFSPYNTSSPYTGFLTVRKLFQLRETWSGTTYTRFTGHVDSWPTDWPDQTSQWCSLHVTDAFRALNLADITSTGYAAKVAADGAVNYWRLGDVVGATSAQPTIGTNIGNNDTTGSFVAVVFGQPGAMVADPTTSTEFGSATNESQLKFTGSGLTAGNLAAGASIEVWIKNTASAPAGMCLFDAVASDGVSQLGMHSTDGVNLIVTNTNTNKGGTWASFGTLNDGKWHHLVLTSTAASVILYVDGASVGTFSGAGSGAAVTTYLHAGNDASGFSAWLQDYAIYPSSLSSGTVSNHFTIATFAQQSTDTRIGRILDTVSWSSGARALDAGKSTVQAVTSSLTTTSSLSHMQQAEGTEGGALFMTGDGKVKFLSRTTLQSNSLYTTSQQKIGDNTAGGDMPFQPSPQLALDDIDLYNEAIATRTGGNTQTTTNSTSITNNGRVTWNSPTTLLGISDSEVLALTQYIVSKFATPVVRVQSVTVDLLELITPNIVANLLSLDLLYQITVERTVTPDGGTAFTQTANIERIHEQVTPDSWKVTFQLAKADPSWWILGTSQLGTSTALAW